VAALYRITKENELKPAIFITVLIVASFACQKSKLSMQHHVSSKAVLPKVADSVVVGSKPILRIGVRVERSLPEMDTTSTIPLSLNIFRWKGELFVLDSLTSKTEQLTFTRGKIDTFFLSPTRKYLVCLKLVGTAKEPGLWTSEDKAPDVPAYNIVVIEILKRRLVREIEPRTFDLTFTKWISTSRFHFTEGDGFAVGEFYVYDAFRDTLQELPYGKFE